MKIKIIVISNVLFFVLVSLFILFSCNKENHNQEGSQNMECKTENLGIHNVSDSSMIEFPYKDKYYSYYFIDSLGKLLKFNNWGISSDVRMTKQYKKCANNKLDGPYYYYECRGMQAFIFCDSLKISFDISLYLQILETVPTPRFSEVMSIYINFIDSLPVSLNGLLLDVVFNKRDTYLNDKLYLNKKFEVIKLNNIVFENVYTDNLDINKSDIFYNTEFGIIAFRDKSRKLWVYVDRK
jgi:hypothetical protein